MAWLLGVSQIAQTSSSLTGSFAGSFTYDPDKYGDKESVAGVRIYSLYSTFRITLNVMVSGGIYPAQFFNETE